MDVLAKYDGKLTFEVPQEMEYLDCIVHESMRINVVAPLISRVCTKEYTLPLIDGQKEPVKIYPGTCVQISVRALHMYVLNKFIHLLIFNHLQFKFALGIPNIFQNQKYLIRIGLRKKSVEIATKPCIYRLVKGQELVQVENLQWRK